MNNKANFRQKVYSLVSHIPVGRVMTYGDIASHCGQPNAARIVGGLAHFGPTELPWHRVVNRFGGMASGYYGGKSSHQKALEAEGLKVENYILVDFEEIRWQPNSH